ncbi:MAG: hypothetical protein AAGD07_04020 [Planctomycetota bacterium]
MTPASKTPTLLRLPNLNESQVVGPQSHPVDEAITTVHGEHATSMPHKQVSEGPPTGSTQAVAEQLPEQSSNHSAAAIKSELDQAARQQPPANEPDAFVRLDQAEADLTGTHLDVIEERKREKASHEVLATEEPGFWLTILASRKVLAAALAVIAAWAIFGPRGQQSESNLPSADQLVVTEPDIKNLENALTEEASMEALGSSGVVVDEGALVDSSLGTIAPPDAYVAKPSDPIETAELALNEAGEMDLFAPTDANRFRPETRAANDMNDLAMSEANATASMDAFLDQSNLPDLASQNAVAMASEESDLVNPSPATSQLMDSLPPAADGTVETSVSLGEETSGFVPLRTRTPNAVVDWSQYLPPATPMAGFPTTAAPTAPNFQYALPNEAVNPAVFDGPQARVATQPR